MFVLWGSGGAWGWFGFFWSKRWGRFKASAARDDRIVMIELAGRKKLLVTTDNRDGFLPAIK